ncbi:MAG: VWA domain-containing protein [Acidobacteriota bacterium]
MILRRRSRRPSHLTSSVPALALAATLLLPLALPTVGLANSALPPEHRIFLGVLDFPEEQRAFLQDGPGFLLSRNQRDELLDRDSVGRQEWIDAFLADPLPETEANELVEGIARRRALARAEIGSFQDVRARLLFLHGRPTERFLVDCAETFKPLELWFYPGRSVPAVVFREQADQPFRQWLPLDGKRVLYTEEMNYYLDQWEELKNRISGGKRIDRAFCEDSERVDELVGIDGLFGFEQDRPKDSAFQAYLRSPDDLSGWAQRAANTEATDEEELAGGELRVFFPEKRGQRMVTYMELSIDDPSQLGVFEERESKQLRLIAEGTLERPGSFFEDFRVRYQIPVPEDGFENKIGLTAERLLRPGSQFLLRLKVIDEITGRVFYASRGLTISRTTVPLPENPEVPAEALFEAAEDFAAEQPLAGYDSLVVVPPVSDVVFGLWRAEALVTGARIQRVKFFVDGKQVLSRKGPPFTAELRLETYPREQTVRIEGYDAQGELVAADEVVLNQPRGELRVRVLEPARGQQGSGITPVRAEVVVPEEKRVEKVEIRVNEELQQELTRPPWETEVEIPAGGGDLTYITVTAYLDDGLRAEDVRFINAPENLEEVDVNLVELFTTVTERGGGLAQGLGQSAFRVLEDGRPQTISKFELVENLPLSIGITIDTSGSMVESLGEAQRAAVEFLRRIVTPRDRAFAVSFADRPEILMARTSDVGAVESRLENLVADGSTSLHDAVVTSLYYYRGIRGRRAMVLLSDGEDTSSSLEFSEALEYAKRSGVAIYTIGLRISSIELGVRNKLDALARETGGRTFFIDNADELLGVYSRIEKELRSQYLLAYSSNSTKEKELYREIEVKVEGGRRARTISGYYP